MTKRGQKFALDLSSTLTYQNIKKMYGDVYENKKECEVSVKLD